MTIEQERQSAALMRLAQDGDQMAYASLLVQLTAIARGYVRRRLGGASAWTDDVVQDALLAVHAARHTYDPSRPFAPWFYAILFNRLIDVVRRERRLQAREVLTATVPEPSAAADGRNEIDGDAIRAAVQALPPRQRDVIEAMKFRDESVREVAGRLNMSESAVKVTAHRGYQTLRRLFAKGRR